MSIVAEKQGAFNVPSESKALTPEQRRAATFNRIELTGQAQDRMEAIRRVSGYHPWEVAEAAADSAKFRFWFEKLPADLSGVVLTPLYAFVETSDERHELATRELSWAPDPANLSDEYNGPIGENWEPQRQNVRKWEDAVKFREESFSKRFEAKERLMDNPDASVPNQLREAANSLMCLACDMADNGGTTSEWEDCSSQADIEAITAALHIVFQAAKELNAAAARSAAAMEAELRRDLARAEKLREAWAKEAKEGVKA